MRPLDGPATECRPVGESRFPLQIFQTPQKTKTYLVFKCDHLMGPRPSVGQLANLVSRSKFLHFYCRNSLRLVYQCDPLMGPRPSVGQLANLVSRSKFLHSYFCNSLRLPYQCDPLMGPRPSVGHCFATSSNLFPAPNFFFSIHIS